MQKTLDFFLLEAGMTAITFRWVICMSWLSWVEPHGKNPESHNYVERRHLCISSFQLNLGLRAKSTIYCCLLNFTHYVRCCQVNLISKPRFCKSTMCIKPGSNRKTSMTLKKSGGILILKKLVFFPQHCYSNTVTSSREKQAGNPIRDRLNQ